MTAPGNISNQGFVLPVLLVALAAMSLITIATLRQFMQISDTTAAAHESLRAEIDAMTIEARLAHLITTEPMGVRHIRNGERRTSLLEEMGVAPSDIFGDGAGAITFGAAQTEVSAPVLLDGRPYGAGGSLGLSRDYDVRLQDLAGLLNLNSATPAQLIAFLTNSEITGARARNLAANLWDYTDTDDDEQFGGAEAFDYRTKNLPAPANYHLLTRAGAFHIMDWNEALTAQARGNVYEFAWADIRAPHTNINTAPAEVLQAIYGLDANSAVAAVAEREIAPFTSLYDMTNRIGTKVEGDDLVAHSFPSRGVRIRITPQHDTLTRESVAYISGSGADRPFFVKRNRRFHRNDKERPRGTDTDSAPQPLPQASGIFSDGGRRP